MAEIDQVANEVGGDADESSAAGSGA
ncbi:hypothetical protein EMIT0P258_50095 [Pseudomonas sp. IT-P258]